MARLCNSCNARFPWFVGALLALSLTVVVPIHLSHRFSPTRATVHAGLRAAHHTVVDQLDGRPEARIDRMGRSTAPHSIATVLFVSVVPRILLRMTAAPPRVRMLRHLRIAPAHADDGGDPSSHIASLRV